MSGLTPGAFITFDGESIPGRVPPRLIVRDNPMINDQHNAVKHLYQEFARHNGLSLAGYHVNEARLSDGTRVRMESNNGVDRVTVWPGRSGYETLYDIRPLAFFASLDAPLGVAPTEVGGAPVVVHTLDSVTRPVSRWANPPLKDDQSSQYTMQFAHHDRAGYGYSAPELRKALPGNVDWYDPRSDSPHYGLVLSWWNYFQGRYQRFDHPVEAKLDNEFFDDCRAVGPVAASSRQRTGVIYNFASAAQTVWCNGVPLARVPGYVVGACLFRDEDEGGSFMRILSYQPGTGAITVYEGAISLEDSWIDVGQSMINVRAKGPAIVLPMTKGGKRSVLLHPTHCNASGTRAVIVQTPPDDGDYIESGIYMREIDLDTITASDVALPWTQNTPDEPVEAGTVTTDFTEIKTVALTVYIALLPLNLHDITRSSQLSRALDATVVTNVLVCADYRLDELEYVYTENKRRVWDILSGSGQSSLVRDTTTYYQYRYYTYTSYESSASESAQGSQGVDGRFRVIHSSLGELGACEYGVDISISGSGSGAAGGTLHVLTYEEANITTQSSVQSNESYNYSWKEIGTRDIQYAGVIGDMRVRALDAYISFENRGACEGSFLISNSSSADYSFHVKSEGASINTSGSSTTTGHIDSGPQFARAPLVVRRLDLSGVAQASGLVSADFSLGPAQDVNNNAQVTTSSSPATSGRAPDVIMVGSRSGAGFLYSVSSDFVYRSSESNVTHYVARFKDAGIPRNRTIGVYELGATSSFDGQLYYQATANWPESGSPYDQDAELPVDATLLTFNAKIYNTMTGEELVDLNADPNLNPCPGLGKTCTTMLFLGPVRDPKGRYNDCPTYLMKPE